VRQVGLQVLESASGLGWLCFGVPLLILVVGGTMKVAWLTAGETDELVKDCTDCTDAGFSDPYRWKARLADAMAAARQAKSGLESLELLAKTCHRLGQRSLAMICVRLAMRRGKTPELHQFFETLLQENPPDPLGVRWGPQDGGPTSASGSDRSQPPGYPDP
jgi:hypothetical protein